VSHQNLIGQKTEALSLGVLISTRRIIVGVMSLLVAMMAYLRAFFLQRHRLALESIGPTPTDRRVQTQAASPQTQSSRPAIVDRTASPVFRLAQMLSFWSDQE
jgi:hypothetical protein